MRAIELKPMTYGFSNRKFINGCDVDGLLGVWLKMVC
jgi:hypothetical protein